MSYRVSPACTRYTLQVPLAGLGTSTPGAAGEGGGLGCQEGGARAQKVPGGWCSMPGRALPGMPPGWIVAGSIMLAGRDCRHESSKPKVTARRRWPPTLSAVRGEGWNLDVLARLQHAGGVAAEVGVHGLQG